MWFFKKFVDDYYFILFEVFFVSSISNRLVIILIYWLQKIVTRYFHLGSLQAPTGRVIRNTIKVILLV